MPRDLTFVWDLLQPKPARGGPGYLLPPFAYVAKEHGSVAIGAGRRALDELIKIATTTRGTFRSSKLDERQVVHRQIAEADLKLRAARALMHERYDALYDKVTAGHLPDGADIADVRAICVHATETAIGVATMAYHFAGNTGLHHPQRHRPAAARPQHHRHPSGDERHGLREPRQVPPRPAGRSARLSGRRARESKR